VTVDSEGSHATNPLDNHNRMIDYDIYLNARA